MSAQTPDFTGHVALVTGAATGIGRATALAFAQAGASVVVADIAAEAGAQTTAEITEAGGQARFYQVDVADAGSVADMIAQTIGWYGRLDYAHNNAGTLIQEVAIAEMEDAAWDRVLAVNLKGVFLCMKHEIKQMLAQGGGAIVNTTSVTAFRTVLNSAAYSSSKAGIVALTRIAAAENGQFGIRVNAIAPAGIDTPMLAKGLGEDEERRRNVAKTRVMRRLGTPQEAAQAVLWLCSDGASYITGHTLAVDGGVLASP
jgi:NAD(P)-dependent dehydrogenase (short-subunit alcohol dehydrogenase family)